MPHLMPRDLSLEAFAAVSAAIAEGDEPLDQILARYELDLEQWRVVSDQWSRIIAADEPAADTYAEAFALAQDGLKPLPEMTPEDWAELVVDVGAKGRAALARRALGQSDHLRLTRHWARVLGKDRTLAARYAEGFYRATTKRGIA